MKMISVFVEAFANAYELSNYLSFNEWLLSF